MGESKDGDLRLDFNRRLKLEFHGSKVASDAGLLPYRGLDDALGLSEIAGGVLTESRRGKNARHGLVGHFRQSVFARLGGSDDVNDADRLSLDPVMQWIDRVQDRRPPIRIILDKDSSVSPSHGDQEGTAFAKGKPSHRQNAHQHPPIARRRPRAQARRGAPLTGLAPRRSPSAYRSPIARHGVSPPGARS